MEPGGQLYASATQRGCRLRRVGSFARISWATKAIGKAPFGADREERHQGVPLFLEELAKHVEEIPSRAAFREDRQPVRSGSIHEPIPNHLYSFLAEHLDLLDAQVGAKRVAQTAAVFGQDFSLALLAKVPSLQWIGGTVSTQQWITLLNAGLFVRSGGGAQNMSFRHSVFREIAYASLLRSTRRDLHGEIATVLIDEGAAAAEPDIAAYHLTEAQKPREAIEYWTIAGLRSNERVGGRRSLQSVLQRPRVDPPVAGGTVRRAGVAASHRVRRRGLSHRGLLRQGH